ncbi:MAG: glycosyltransferase family 2 protein [FCB group bacterium]|nr:glycosyltransferase family 2 protein [FCB group bacterium]
MDSTDLDVRRRVAALVPCFNAGHRVRPVIEGLLERVDHVIVVDDGSTDGAVEALRDLDARIITFPENRGKGQALLAGFREALALPAVDAVAVVDADGQHAPGELPGLYETFWREAADLVIGTRKFELERVPWRSRFGNVLTRTLTRWILGQNIPDTQSGYRLHSRRLLEHIVATVEGGRYETEMEILVVAVRRGYRVVPSPIETIYEQGNPSSHFNKLRDSFLIYRRLFRTALRVRANQ